MIRNPTRVDSPDQMARLVRHSLEAPQTRNTNWTAIDYTVRDEDDDVYVSALATITLPAPAGYINRVFIIVRTGAGNVTVQSADGSTISGSATKVIGTQWDVLRCKASDVTGAGSYAYVLV